MTWHALSGAKVGVPRFGTGSINWAGSENRTVAMSDTPINLERWGVSHRGGSIAEQDVTVSAWRKQLNSSWCVPYFFRMLRNVRSLDESSGVLSTAALGTETVGVDAPGRS